MGLLSDYLALKARQKRMIKPDHRIPPAAWHSSGWKGFRFGMAPGDVCGLLTGFAFTYDDGIAFDHNVQALTVEPAPPWTRASEPSDPDLLALAGRSLAAEFTFVGGRLFRISLEAECEGGDECRSARTRFEWMLKVRSLLEEKYGPADEENATHLPTHRPVEPPPSAKPWFRDRLRQWNSNDVWHRSGTTIRLLAFGPRIVYELDTLTAEAAQFEMPFYERLAAAYGGRQPGSGGDVV